MMQSDVIVLGAGIVGIGLALNLQDKGRSVTLIDRSGPGEGTSFGNAGLIQREAVKPYTFPDDPVTLIQAALNMRVDAYYQLGSLKNGRRRGSTNTGSSRPRTRSPAARRRGRRCSRSACRA
jgi:glycine/D-amino acid oxidase-like deaminating enzyme